jgi:toxin ParE1/3/4
VKFRISEHADVQLSQIYEYGLKEWGRAQSDKYFTGLFDTFGMLCDFPESGRVFTSDWDFTEDVKLRYMPYRTHQIFYAIADDTIFVIAVGSHWQMPDSVLP